MAKNYLKECEFFSSDLFQIVYKFRKSNYHFQSYLSYDFKQERYAQWPQNYTRGRCTYCGCATSPVLEQDQRSWILNIVTIIKY